MLDAEEVWQAARELLLSSGLEKREMLEKELEEFPEKIQIDKETFIQWMVEQYINMFLSTIDLLAFEGEKDDKRK